MPAALRALLPPAVLPLLCTLMLANVSLEAPSDLAHLAQCGAFPDLQALHLSGFCPGVHTTAVRASLAAMRMHAPRLMVVQTRLGSEAGADDIYESEGEDDEDEDEDDEYEGEDGDDDSEDNED